MTALTTAVKLDHPATKVGPVVAIVGLGVIAATSIANWASINDVGSNPASIAETSLEAGGWGVLGLGITKVAVAIVLVGIISHLWGRVSTLKESIPGLHARPNASPVQQKQRRVVRSATVPKRLPIHQMATLMWRPMLAMGAMAVFTGAIVRSLASDEGAGTDRFRELAAWGIGIEFLGEALLLSAISFLLARILASLREGGSQVQDSAGASINVLKMPATAKAFVGLMMAGLMVGIGQFVASIVLAGRADDATGYSELATFLGPLREFSLGLLLAGIVLALITIGNVLNFQFDRVRTLIRH